MERIASFNVDHTRLLPGVYVSRVDGDIVTYDIRIKRPNTDDLISNSELHTFEHLFATALRNSDMKDYIIYFGPMGCQTGYYCLMKTPEGLNVMQYFKRMLQSIIDDFDFMPGCSEYECGNYRNLDLELGKRKAQEYLDLFKDFDDLCEYPEKVD